MQREAIHKILLFKIIFTPCKKQWHTVFSKKQVNRINQQRSLSSPLCIGGSNQESNPRGYEPPKVAHSTKEKATQ